MLDIVPSLLAKVKQDFRGGIEDSQTIKKINDMLADGAATYAAANDYAIEAGKILADAYKNNITEEVLPDGKMYYNIAKRLIEPTMAEDHDIVSAMAMEIQTSLNGQAGLGIRAHKAPANLDRIDGIIQRLATAQAFSEIAWILDEPVINFSQSIIDATAQLNAEFQFKAGLQARIIRKQAGNCCEYCALLAGEYTYPRVPTDIYSRHRFCKCTVEYYPSDNRRQNVWTKKWVSN